MTALHETMNEDVLQAAFIPLAAVLAYCFNENNNRKRLRRKLSRKLLLKLLFHKRGGRSSFISFIDTALVAAVILSFIFLPWYIGLLLLGLSVFVIMKYDLHGGK